MTTLDDLSQPYLPPASGSDNAEFGKAISQVFLTSVIAAKVLDWSGISKRWARSGFMTEHFNDEITSKFVTVFKLGLAPLLVEAAMHGMRQAQAEFVVGVNVPQAVVNEWAAVYAEQVAQQIANQSTLAIQDAVNVGINGRLPAPALADRAQQIYGLDPRAANTFQALTTSKALPRDNNLLQVLAHLLVTRGGIIGEVHSIAGINFGKQLVYMQAQEQGQLMTDARKVWLTALDERVCEICGPMDGIAVPINDMFEVQLPFPKTGRGKNRKSTKVMVPPVHPNCRCTIVTEDRVEGGIITRTSRKRGDLFSEPEDTFFQKNFWVWEEQAHPRDESGKFASHGFHHDGKLSRSEQLADVAALAAISPFAARHVPLVRKIAFMVAPKTEKVQGTGLNLIPRVSNIEAMAPMAQRPMIYGMRQGGLPVGNFHPKILQHLDEAPPEGLHAIYHPKAYTHMEGSSLQETLKNVEEHIHTKEMEHSVLMTPSGRILSFGHGNEHSAPAALPASLPRSTGRFLSFTHNHPSTEGKDIVLSAQDIVASAASGIGRIRAVTPNGKVTEVVIRPGVTNRQMEDFAQRAGEHALEGQSEAFVKAFPPPKRKPRTGSGTRSFDEILEEMRTRTRAPVQPDFNNPAHLEWAANRQSGRMEEFYRQEHLDPNGVIHYTHTTKGGLSKGLVSKDWTKWNAEHKHQAEEGATGAVGAAAGQGLYQSTAYGPRTISRYVNNHNSESKSQRLWYERSLNKTPLRTLREKNKAAMSASQRDKRIKTARAALTEKLGRPPTDTEFYRAGGAKSLGVSGHRLEQALSYTHGGKSGKVVGTLATLATAAAAEEALRRHAEKKR